jgi:small-conductance mechanosensitive channel
MSPFSRNCILIVLIAAASLADEAGNRPEGSAPVVLDGITLFSVKTWVGPYSPEVRAKAISDRLGRVAADRTAPINNITINDGGEYTDITAGDRPLLAITDADAKAAGKTRQQLAKDYKPIIEGALQNYREARRIKNLALDFVLVIAATIALVGLWWLLHRLGLALNRWLLSLHGAKIRDLRFQRADVLTASQIVGILSGIGRAMRIAVGLVGSYFYLVYALSLLPWTQTWSATLFGYVIGTFAMVFRSIADYIPNLFVIVVVATIIRYCIKLAKFVFRELGNGNVSISGFYPGWSDPTYKIIRFLLLVFGAIVVFPYIPGSRSAGFQGISVFLGLLLSLGSAGAVSNIIAGVLMTYTRAFDNGDRVRIGETIGDVIGRTLLATRIRTIKNEDITVPNSLVLSSHIVNYSAQAKDSGLILHTTVTIGYDAPWRQVHELLIAAALSTADVSKEPMPFVLQTALNDFYVSYEINAFTDKPNQMVNTYAELHQNIQDHFNEAGLEICSPHFAAVRDANRIAIPDRYVSDSYVAPAFRLDLASRARRKTQGA